MLKSPLTLSFHQIIGKNSSYTSELRVTDCLPTVNALWAGESLCFHGTFTNVSGLDGFAVGLWEFMGVYSALLVPESLKSNLLGNTSKFSLGLVHH